MTQRQKTKRTNPEPLYLEGFEGLEGPLSDWICDLLSRLDKERNSGVLALINASYHFSVAVIDENQPRMCLYVGKLGELDDSERSLKYDITLDYRNTTIDFLGGGDNNPELRSQAENITEALNQLLAG